MLNIISFWFDLTVLNDLYV